MKKARLVSFKGGWTGSWNTSEQYDDRPFSRRNLSGMFEAMFQKSMSHGGGDILYMPPSGRSKVIVKCTCGECKLSKFAKKVLLPRCA